MSAIKTPVKAIQGFLKWHVRDAWNDHLIGPLEENTAKEIAAALNATLGIGLSVETLEQRVVERAFALVREADFHRVELQKERDSILALIPAAPNNEAGHD